MNRTRLVAPALTAFLLLASPAVSLAAPALFFSDLTSGPKTGLGDGLGQGAIVTVWGAGLGSAQGSSKAFFRDSSGVAHEAAHVYVWRNADGTLPGGPADLYSSHRMQEVAFSIPAASADGAGSLYVVVSGGSSNTLGFTVRSGAIFHARGTGDDTAGTGSWAAPWKTPDGARLQSGDILYLGDLALSSSTAITLMHDVNPADRPKAFVGYPGTRTTAAGTNSGIGDWNSPPYSEHWVFSKLAVSSQGEGVASVKGMRAIGLSITGPQAQGQSGAISGAGDRTSGAKCFGNYIYDFGLNDYSTRLHHVFYLSNRDGTPNESYELGWNHLDGNHARGGLHNFDEGVCGDFTGTMKIHDNVVKNQSGACFDLIGGGDPCFTMPVDVYNNVFINCGLSPFFDSAITLVRQGTKSHVRFYNNVLFGYGVAGSTSTSEAAVYVQDHGSGVWNFGGTWEWVNNIVVDTQNLPFSHPTYWHMPQRSEHNLWWHGGDSTPAALPVWDPSGALVDPLFVDPQNFDFHLQPGSPAIDTGADLSAVVPTDLEGTLRPQGAAFDIGASEFAPTCVLPTDCTQPPPCRTATGATCAGGGCNYPPEADGTACSPDQNACTRDVCQAGGCAHPILPGCLDAGAPDAGGESDGGSGSGSDAGTTPDAGDAGPAVGRGCSGCSAGAPGAVLFFGLALLGAMRRRRG